MKEQLTPKAKWFIRTACLYVGLVIWGYWWWPAGAAGALMWIYEMVILDDELRPAFLTRRGIK